MIATVYADEKADALNRLAALVESIIHPPTSSVVTLPTRVRHYNDRYRR
jgi:hypothetical protein